MFKNLTIAQIAEIVMCLLNDPKETDMAGIQQCFEIMLNETKKPKYIYKPWPDVMACLTGFEGFMSWDFESTPDYLFDAINSKKISMERLTEILINCITPV